jgi:hypothetical protein
VPPELWGIDAHTRALIEADAQAFRISGWRWVNGPVFGRIDGTRLAREFHTGNVPTSKLDPRFWMTRNEYEKEVAEAWGLTAKRRRRRRIFVWSMWAIWAIPVVAVLASPLPDGLVGLSIWWALFQAFLLAESSLD